MRLILCFLVLSAIPSPGVLGDEVQNEFKELRGKWKTVGMEAGGQAFPKDAVMDFTVNVGLDGKSTGIMPQEEFRFTMTIDPKKNPKTINNAHETGSQKGKKQYGIYKLEGDKWTVCMSMPGVKETDRPKSFDTKGTSNVVFVFERVKEGK